ncbi:MAG: GFA family protein, partial [Rhodobacterales bacterium]|nr:GFA family protein [Rhodobacterales bacterium]
YGFKDVYGALIQNFSFTPTAHINYGNSILKIKDGLPKFKDFPSDFGGSGELLEE